MKDGNADIAFGNHGVGVALNVPRYYAERYTTFP